MTEDLIGNLVRYRRDDGVVITGRVKGVNGHVVVIETPGFKGEAYAPIEKVELVESAH